MKLTFEDIQGRESRHLLQTYRRFIFDIRLFYFIFGGCVKNIRFACKEIFEKEGDRFVTDPAFPQGLSGS